MSAALYSPRNHEIPRSLFIRGYTEREDAEGREKFLKSGAVRRFPRAQLRHYHRVKGFASRGLVGLFSQRVLCVRLTA